MTTNCVHLWGKLVADFTWLFLMMPADLNADFEDINTLLCAFGKCTSSPLPKTDFLTPSGHLKSTTDWLLSLSRSWYAYIITWSQGFVLLFLSIQYILLIACLIVCIENLCKYYLCLRNMPSAQIVFWRCILEGMLCWIWDETSVTHSEK